MTLLLLSVHMRPLSMQPRVRRGSQPKNNSGYMLEIDAIIQYKSKSRRGIHRFSVSAYSTVIAFSGTLMIQAETVSSLFLSMRSS